MSRYLTCRDRAVERQCNKKGEERRYASLDIPILCPVDFIWDNDVASYDVILESIDLN